MDHPAEPELAFVLEGGRPVTLPVRSARLVIAGWTGRDPVARDRHIAELEALGVQRPPHVPVFYRAAASRLTTADRIECSGETSSGEVEFVLLKMGGEVLVGVGSDHTDREVETYGVTVSKQMCDKPLSPELWRLSEVGDHWDKLILRAWATIDGERILYQEGSVAAMLPPDAVMAGCPGGFGDGTVMFCGTLAAHGGIRPALRFDYEIEDPVLRRRIRHGYEVVALPIDG